MKILVLVVLLLAVPAKASTTDWVTYSFNPKLVLIDHSDDSIRIQPKTGSGSEFSSGFSICFRMMFHYWNIAEIFSSESVVIGFGNYTWPRGFFKIGKAWYIGDWPDTVEKSPYVWYSTCLAYNASSFEVVHALNGVPIFEMADKLRLGNLDLKMNYTIQV